MGRKKKKAPEHENHERWLVSYADFITLLFAFFVVMYSVSQVNEGKFRVLSESLVSSFKSPTRSLAPIQVGKNVRAPHQFSMTMQNIPFQTTRAPIKLTQLKSMREDAIDIAENGKQGADTGGSRGAMDTIAEDVENALGPLIDQDMITLRKNKQSLEIEINSEILFASGSSGLAKGARGVLSALAEILKELPNRINVEGFTDNLPIRNRIYPSNWELSAGRAATVVRLFASYGVNPAQMVSIGYGEHRPIADNTTPEGRAANRRVVIVVLSPEPKGDDDPALKQLGRFSYVNSNLATPTVTGLYP